MFLKKDSWYYFICVLLIYRVGFMYQISVSLFTQWQLFKACAIMYTHDRQHSVACILCMHMYRTDHPLLGCFPGTRNPAVMSILHMSPYWPVGCFSAMGMRGHGMYRYVPHPLHLSWHLLPGSHVHYCVLVFNC